MQLGSEEERIYQEWRQCRCDHWLAAGAGASNTAAVVTVGGEGLLECESEIEFPLIGYKSSTISGLFEIGNVANSFKD